MSNRFSRFLRSNKDENRLSQKRIEAFDGIRPHNPLPTTSSQNGWTSTALASSSTASSPPVPNINQPASPPTQETPSGLQYFNNAHDFVLEGVIFQHVRGDFKHYTGADPDIIELSGLAYASDAAYNSGKQCLPDTRTEVIDEIREWAHNSDPSAPRILWLHGAAGTGKSAIAHTIAIEFDRNNELGSCFVFDKAFLAECRHEKLFSTIARDLAARNSDFKEDIANAVRQRVWLKSTRDLSQQWDHFIVNPARNLCDAGPILIIIDALDESGPPSSRSKLLSILANEVGRLPSNIRFLLTSRALDDITEKLAQSAHVLYMDLNMVPKSIIIRDIAAYIFFQLWQVDGEFFDDTKIGLLAERSEGLFQWAYVACELIKGTGQISDPKKQFKKLMEMPAASALGKLDHLYETVLQTIIPEEDEDSLNLFCSVMAQILTTFEPLSLQALSTMRNNFPTSSADANDVRLVIKHMGALLSGTTDPSIPIRLLHSSFHDYLTDASRSKKFYVDKSLHVSNLASACLRVMNDELHFNICRLGSSYRFNSDIPDLAERTKQLVSAQLSYSCRYWTNHVQMQPYSEEAAENVETFMGQCFLFWLEVLSLLKSVSIAAPSLASVLAWVSNVKAQGILHEFLVEGQNFVRMFGGMIAQSAPHIYLSALPFTPTRSIIYKHFSSSFLRVLRLASGQATTWPACQRVLTGHTGWVTCVSFSPDGKRIFSGSWDKTIRVWDSETGETIIERDSGHRSPVTCLSVSSDGHFVVTGSYDRCLRIWNVFTGEALAAPLQGHTDDVRSVSFSPDGKYIVSASCNRTIRIWDWENSKESPVTLVGHTKSVNSVTFTSNGRFFASGSEDKTVRIWSMESYNEAPQSPMCGHTAPVNSVAFSSGANLLVSGSDDKIICVWIIENEQGVLVHSLTGHTGPIASVIFSGDNRHIISGSEDGTIRMWDLEAGQTLASFEDHKSWVKAVVLSKDGKRIVSASTDNTLRIWNAQVRNSLTHQQVNTTVHCLRYSQDGRFIASSQNDTISVWDANTGNAILGPLYGHTKRVNCLDFSSNGDRLISGSDDGTVRVWDMETGKQILPSLSRHSGAVSCIACSPDGRRIVSGSSDRSICIWDAETGKLVAPPFRGHGQYISSIAFLPGDSSCILSGAYDKTIRKWNIDKHKADGVPFTGSSNWDMNSSITFIQFSADGKWHIISSILGRMIHIWTGKTGEEMVMPLVGHSKWIRSIAFFPDATHMISGSDDKTIRLWNAETGKEIGIPLRGHTDEITSVAISPDGKYIVSAARDKTIRLWTAPSLPAITDRQVVSPTQRICFSSNPSHSLREPQWLFEGMPDNVTVNKDWNEFIMTQEDGWVLGPKGQLLFWVPHNHLPGFFTPWTKCLFAAVGTELDLSNYVHGPQWELCCSYN